MTTIKDFLKKHPVAVYYFTTFLISWGGLAIILGGPSKITSQPSTVPFLPLYFMTIAGPLIAGILLTGLYGGIKAYREFFSRLLKWRVNVSWYLIALLIAPLTVFAALFTLSLISPVFLPGILSSGNNPISSMFGLPSGNKVALILFVLMLGLFNGFVEEVGWTGFLTPKFKSSHKLIASGLNIGIMWGLWHFLSNYIGSAAGAGTLPLPLYLFITLFSFLPPFRIIMTLVYDHTKSLFIGILMHASLDIFWLLSMPITITGNERVIWYIMWAAILWIAVAIITKSSTSRARV